MVHFLPKYFIKNMGYSCNLLLLILATMMNPTLQCRGILSSRLSDDVDSSCERISDFATCLAAKHAAMDSPFGADMPKLIAEALSNITKSACGFECAIRTDAGEQEHATPYLLALGPALKICAFNHILQVNINPGKACDNLPDLVVCFLVKSRIRTSREAIELGTHIMAHVIQAKFGVTCDRSFSTRRIQKKCPKRPKRY
ncbi:unnamed protein product [Lymnaea stagnalis]|uniref:Uncharacterized protein n=1 Tax=Lymnaea stagnalis TaxID=6523 RepID=A0AAV2GXJ5_LYMST